MTNAEYYLKEETMKKEFIDEFKEKYASNKAEAAVLLLALELFFNDKRQENKPTLTEDERVILKNIQSNENYKTYKKIGRTTYGSLYLTYDLNKETASELGELETDVTEFEMYSNLFKFIKERRRI